MGVAENDVGGRPIGVPRPGDCTLLCSLQYFDDVCDRRIAESGTGVMSEDRRTCVSCKLGGGKP